MVTVVMPCRDEERFIGPALRSLLDGSWPHERLEVLVVDGRSSDGTRDQVAQIAGTGAPVRLLDNPRQSTPAALNLGIRQARGEIIVRADGHCLYPPNFVAAQVRALDAEGAAMAGTALDNGPAAPTTMAEAIACALGSPFATGSPFRFRRRSGPADTAAFGCWRRELFGRLGLFDERLLRNQDIEMAARIRRAGGRVHLCVDVRVRYFPRASLRALMRQAIENGTWSAFTQRLHPYSFRWRHLLPALFFLGVLAASALFFAGALVDRRIAAAGAALIAPYAAINLGASLALAARRRRLSFLLLLPAVFAGSHFAYGFGIVRGWWLVATGGWRGRLGLGEALWIVGEG